MNHKGVFKKSILHSAILSALYSVSGHVMADSCPNPDESGNIHVQSAESCSGGIKPNVSVNDVGIEGLVNGDVVNNDGITDFWMNGGTLTGSFVNNGDGDEVNIINGSEIFNDIRNYGTLNSVLIDDGPGKDTVVHGSVVNEGKVREIRLSGVQAQVEGDILSASDGEVNSILVQDGATVAGNIISNGKLGSGVVHSGSVEGNIEVASDGFFGIGLFDAANIGGNVVNSGNGFVMTHANGSTIEGSMVNKGGISTMEVFDGATVVKDLLNQGSVQHQIFLRDNAKIKGDLNNSGLIEDGIAVLSGSSIDGALINNVDGVSHGSIEVVDQVTIGGNIENRGKISYDSDKRTNLANYLPKALIDIAEARQDGEVPVPPLAYEVDLAAIRVDHQTTVTGKVINSGSIDISIPVIQPPADLPPELMSGGPYLPSLERDGDAYSLELNSLSGISVSSGSTTGEVVNTGTISVNAGLENSFFFSDGDIPLSVNGITVRQGSVVDGITNKGAISADTFGILVEGDGTDGSTKVNGSIVNADGASITSKYNGIFVQSAEVTGSVVNSGEITSIQKDHHPNANGIHVASSLVGGDIVNEGTITSGVEGISLDAALVKGNVINSGDMTVGSDGFWIEGASEIEGDLINTGIIKAIENDGVDIADSTIRGSVLVSGSIEAGDNAIEIDGGFLRNGDPDGETPFVYVLIGGDLNNSASLTSIIPDDDDDDVNGGDGFDMDLVKIGGSILNSGSINVTKRGFDIESINVAGDFNNSGDINADKEGIRIRHSNDYSGKALELADIKPTEIVGNFINSGGITSVNTAVLLEQVSIGGDFSNQGAIESAKASGIDVRASSIVGDFINTGSLTANAELLEKSDEAQRGISLTGNIYDDDGTLSVERSLEVDGNVLNSGDINANDEGIYIKKAIVGGNLGNSGTINANAGIALYDSVFTGQVVNTGTINAKDDGIVLNGTTTGAIVNSGSIIAGTEHDDGHTEGNGIVVYDTTSDVVVQNNADGTINTKDDGIQLDTVDGSTMVTNSGTIEAVEDGVDFDYINGSIILQNTGSITAKQDAVEIYNSTANILIQNTGQLLGQNDDGNTDTFDISGNDGDIRIINTGSMKAVASGSSGDVFDIGNTNGNITISNTGMVEAISSNGSAGSDAFDIWRVSGNLTITNTNVISANTVGGGNDALDLSSINGDLTITNTGTITATGEGDSNNAFDIGDVDGNLKIVNSGEIRSSGSAIDLNSDSDGTLSLENNGTIASANGAAIRVTDKMAGRIVNFGILEGGFYTAPEEPEELSEGGRATDYGAAVAIDYRDSGAALNFVNGQNGSLIGSVSGNIYGSNVDSDLVEFSAGDFSHTIYDVETINITGQVGFTGNILHLNKSSRLNVSNAGTLSMGSGDQVKLEGSYSQDGGMRLLLNQNSGDFSEPLLSVTRQAELGQGSVLSVGVADRDLANIYSAANSQEVHIIHAGEGLTDNGLDVASDSILFRFEKFERASADSELGEEFGVTASVNNLGDLAANAGADANVVTALNALQGDDFSGLQALKDTNPELYNSIYDGTEASLAALGSALLASPDSGIVASQGAQSEALSTILARIADLRTGVSGISAGDGYDASAYRPDALWLRAIYSEGDQDAVTTSKGSYNGYTLRSAGFTLGADKDLTDDLTLGAAFSYATSQVNEQATAQSGVSTETSSYIASLYSAWRNQSYFVDATFNYGVSRNDLNGARWKADFDADHVGISLMGGKGILFNKNDTLLEPQVGFNYTRLDTDSYSYNSGVNVHVGDQSLDAIEFGAGVRLTHSVEVGNGVLLPEFSLMAWHDVAADSVEAQLEFETGGGAFTYFGPEGVKNRYQAGVGTEYLMDNNVTLTGRYDRNWQTGFNSDTWTAKVRYDF